MGIPEQGAYRGRHSGKTPKFQKEGGQAGPGKERNRDLTPEKSGEACLPPAGCPGRDGQQGRQDGWGVGERGAWGREPRRVGEEAPTCAVSFEQ